MGNKLSSSIQNLKSHKTCDKKTKGASLRGYSSLRASLRRSVSFRRMSWISRPHLDCRTWLNQLQLSQYIDAFSCFNGVEEFIYYDEKQIRETFEINFPSHLTRIQASLRDLRHKYESNQKLKVDLRFRNSINIEECHNVSNSEDNVNLSSSSLSIVLGHDSRPSTTSSNNQETTILKENINIMSLRAQDPLPALPYEEDSSTELKRLLESELALDRSDLRSHAWYHGSISRTRAEEVVNRNGCFIIRDCISLPGDFVLTCRWNNQPIHVIIQKTIIQPNTIYERIQYRLEDESYDSVSDLVTAYVGNKQPVTLSSGARISIPVNRTAPISFYASKFAAETEPTKIHGTLNSFSSVVQQRRSAHHSLNREPVSVSCTLVKTFNNSPPRLRRVSRSTFRYQRPSSGVFDEKFDSLNFGEGILKKYDSKVTDDFSSHSLPRRLHQSNELIIPSTGNENQKTKINGFSVRSSSLTSTNIGTAPPKPTRPPLVSKMALESEHEKLTDSNSNDYAEISYDVPKGLSHIPNESFTKMSLSDISPEVNSTNKTSECQKNTKIGSKSLRLSGIYQSIGSDSGNGSGDSVQTSASDSRNRDSEFSFSDSGFLGPDDDNSLTEDSQPIFSPELCPSTAFNLESFSTCLLPPCENKPLESTAFNAIKNMLMENGSRMVAAHLTKIDLDLLNVAHKDCYSSGVTSGIQLIVLSCGSQLRRDLIERTECLRLLVAVTILKMEDILDRAEMINRWIQIADDTKSTIGNLFGFTSIMLGLGCPEVQRLSRTWQLVRQKYTSCAFQFESKLRSTLKNMNDGNDCQPPNTVIPHILPFILFFEKDLEDIYSFRSQNDSLFQWECSNSDFGLQILLTHLQEGRKFAQNSTLYQKNAKLIFDDIPPKDHLILDMFRTEFHLKFLFGSKAACVEREQRMSKFQKVVSTLSYHCEAAE